MPGYEKNLLEEVRKNLEGEKTAVSARLQILLSQDPYADPDRLTDNASSEAEAFEESNHDRVSAQTEELKMQITALDDALARIGNGTYGFCKNCENMINTDRLAILPTATLCLDCKRKK